MLRFIVLKSDLKTDLNKIELEQIKKLSVKYSDKKKLWHHFFIDESNEVAVKGILNSLEIKFAVGPAEKD